MVGINQHPAVPLACREEVDQFPDLERYAGCPSKRCGYFARSANIDLVWCLKTSRQISHGDLKSENILITPALTVLVTDFASSFKPTFLPLNDPSDFSYFYDSSGRRTCYIAPERFYTEDSRIAEEKRQAIASVTAEGTGSWLNAGIGKRDGKVTEQMDVFAAGCVLLEMWTDGASIFTLSELYGYREGKYNELDGILGSLEDASVRVSEPPCYPPGYLLTLSIDLDRKHDRP